MSGKSTNRQSTIESISAVTLATDHMARSVGFYQSLGFELLHGGPQARFCSFAVGGGYLNLVAQPKKQQWSWWGRLILHVSDVDAFYQRVVDLGLSPAQPPRDAQWGERYFHITDPDGHQLSFATPLTPR